MDKSHTDPDRRRVLGLGAAAAVAVAVAAPATEHPGQPAVPPEHRLTDHMRAAYARMRF